MLELKRMSVFLACYIVRYGTMSERKESSTLNERKMSIYPQEKAINKKPTEIPQSKWVRRPYAVAALDLKDIISSCPNDASEKEIFMQYHL